MKGEFPHSCVYCRRYYPKNDLNNVMRGGGECWEWSRMKCDSDENSCRMFDSMDEASLAQRHMYALRAVPCECGFQISLADMFLHARLIAIECESLKDGLSAMASQIVGWSEYFRKCSVALACSKKLHGTIRIYKRYDNDVMSNPQSDMRKRMNTIVKGFPRNIQLNYKFFSEYGCKAVQARIYNVNETPQLMICNDIMNYVGVAEYCQNPVNRELAHLIFTEFMDCAKFMLSFGREIEKGC